MWTDNFIEIILKEYSVKNNIKSYFKFGYFVFFSYGVTKITNPYKNIYYILHILGPLSAVKAQL